MKLQRYLVASLLLLGSSSAMAATSDTIVMSGAVLSTVEVTCTDTAGATALDFDGIVGVTIVQVSDCLATTNDDAGLTVTYDPDANFIKSGTTDVFAFAVKSVADAATAPIAGAFPADDVNDTWATGVAGATPADVYIKFTQNAAADPGTYAANIAVTVLDNS